MDASLTHDVRHAPGAVSQVDRVTSILKWTYGLVPIVAGADKFMHLLTDWEKYLAPVVTDILPFQPHTFMLLVGVIEIIAGIIVLVKPKLGGLIVGLWLMGIALNLLLTGQYYDIAVRDAVMAIGAFSLSMLSGAGKAYAGS
ncbi:tRNA (5-methylaminomethyl-2-thiouridylate)-methyltransferase [Botryobacter ruber]|uniref:tRNA (5-methylaminomethyl-2-thiouridylate)-methyltransferase n=1 Tax=Botryobacter ruber TaxID=2171629 RepID=UPI001F0CCC81|nr:tRNA (5-methylaminomethyl-2-thiouridylate)-methyltransferase [Botryobacter ruber]